MLGKSSRAIQLRASVGRKDERSALARSEFQGRSCNQKMILMIIEASASLHRQEIVPIPFMFWLELSICAEEAERNRAVVGSDLHSLCDGLNLHLPVSGVGAGMKV